MLTSIDLFCRYDIYVIGIRSWPKSLDEVSSQIGKSIEFVQGPGGNTSWKQNGTLWVKASGYKLSEALSKEIFCEVSIANPEVNLNSDDRKPSIESILHASRRESFVVHTHSIGSVSLGCRAKWSKESIDFMKSNRICTIEYYRPGKKLAVQLIKRDRELSNSHGVLLLNHGLVLWGENIHEIYLRLINFEKGLESIYPTNYDLLDHIRRVSLESYLNEKYLTPDHAVFADEMASINKTKTKSWLNDLRWALEIAVAKIENFKDINFLTKLESQFLKNWTSEISRKKLNL